MAENQDEKTTQTGADLGLIEMEVDGKKIMVSPEGKDYLLRQADYSKKTAEVAREREALAGAQKELDTARSFLGALSENEEAAQLMEAVLSGDKEMLKKISGKGTEDEDKTATLAREVDALKRQIQTQNAMSFDEKKRNAEFLEAKNILKSEYGLELDELFPQMQEIAGGSNEKKNRFVTLGIRAALPKLIEKAREEGKNQGREEALSEYVAKSENTPPFSSGSGASPKRGISKTRDAGTEAFHDLLKKGAAGS